MTTIYDADAQELIEKAAVELQKNESVKAPEWAAFVKTGIHKERPPARNDWWYVRAASVLRKIYRQGPVGVSKLRGKYGGKKNRGMKTEHRYRGSGNIIRKILQQLEKAGYVKQVQAVKGHKGRYITADGKKFLDTIASELNGKKQVKGAPEQKTREPVTEPVLKETSKPKKPETKEPKAPPKKSQKVESKEVRSEEQSKKETKKEEQKKAQSQ